MNARTKAVITAVQLVMLGAISHAVIAADEALIVSNRDGNAEIYLVVLPDKAAKNQAEKDQAEKLKPEKNLTNDPGEDTYPTWSPDGKRIAFTSTRDGECNIYAMDAEGKNVKQLTRHQGKYPYCAEWSPDGRRIVYNLRDQNNLLAVLLDPQTGSERALVPNAWDPAWSPDGKKIAFTKFTENGSMSWKPMA